MGEPTSYLTTGLGLAVAAAAIVIVFVAFGSQPESNKSKPAFKPKSKSKSKSTVQDDDDDDDDAELLKGYKKTADGKKTSYFHRELSATDRELLEKSNSGPKPIAQASSPTSSTKAGSAWNSGGTWEEKNLTAFAYERLSGLLSSVRCDLPGGTVLRCTRVRDVAGDCIAATARGKTKLIVDLSCELDWELSSLGSCISGSLSIWDITADRDAKREMTVKSSSSSPKVAAFVRSEEQGLLPAVSAQLDLLLIVLQKAMETGSVSLS